MEVRIDGRSVWVSGLLTRESLAQRIDVDVTGAQRLELLVGDGGNGIAADHADWADAMLLTQPP
jgi:beta-galactosidase